MRKSMLFKILIAVGIVSVIAMLMLIPPVSDQVGAWAKMPGAKIRSIAQTVAGVGIGVALVTWGIAALSVPILGAVMIGLGLGMIAWNVYPLFKPAALGNG